MCHQFMHSWMLRIVLLLAVASLTLTASANDANALYTTSTNRVQKKYVSSFSPQQLNNAVWQTTSTVSRSSTMQSVSQTDISHSVYSSQVSPVGASSPYTTTASLSGPRHAPIGGNVGDPGAITVPLGDIPYLLILTLLAGLLATRTSSTSRTSRTSR